MSRRLTHNYALANPQDIVDKYEISTPPTFKVFKRGEVVDELAGAIRSALESLVATHAA
jgi:thiol-disulfide isomerase/thioredoxin